MHGRHMRVQWSMLLSAGLALHWGSSCASAWRRRGTARHLRRRISDRSAMRWRAQRSGISACFVASPIEDCVGVVLRPMLPPLAPTCAQPRSHLQLQQQPRALRCVDSYGRRQQREEPDRCCSCRRRGGGCGNVQQRDSTQELVVAGRGGLRGAASACSNESKHQNVRWQRRMSI